MRSARDGALALAQMLRAEGGTVAHALREEGVASWADDGLPGPAQLAAAGPRAAARQREYELLVEMIHEGSLLHYGAPRVVADDDRDLALLLGDQLYAMGLSRLAELGDLAAVAQLADLISLLSQARLRGGDSDELVAAIWDAGATAIGWGVNAAHEAAKALARAGDDGAVQALRAVSRRPG